MSIKSDRLEKFKELFEEGVKKRINIKNMKRVVDVEMEVKESDINNKVVSELQALEPFGYGNLQPNFVIRDIKVLNKRILKNRHIKLKLGNGVQAIGFNMPEKFDHIASKADIVFTPSYNEWGGTKSIQYRIIDIE
jgi:single-stranded-DNA-specific exonuclease